MDSCLLSAFAPMRALVVEDDPTSAFLTCEYLQIPGFVCETAADGRAALLAMERQLPDLVICDRRMPDLSGAELLKIVRQRGPEWQNIAFVFLSALSDHRDRMAMLPLRPDGYLCKPLEFVQFDKELAFILNTRKKHLSALAEWKAKNPDS